MSYVSRSDVFVRGEKGPSWFQEFLQSLNELTPPENKSNESVAGVLARYKEETGMGLIVNAEEEAKPELKEHGGYEYPEKDMPTAKKVDLIVLPQSVKGTNCSNCKFVKVTDKEKGLGLCNHPDIQLPVTARMCCALWDNDEVERPWGEMDKNVIASRISKRAGMLGPVAPMKLKKVEDPSKMLEEYGDSELILQQKIDGFKTQAIKDSKGTVKLYTRRGEDFTLNVEPLVKELESKMDNGDFVLGELAYLKNGKQSISDVQTIVGSSPENAKKKLEEKGQLVFYVYDLLWNNSKDITKSSYEERYNKLKKQIGKSKLIQVVDNYPWSELDKAVSDAIKSGGEGVVIKPKKSEYKYASKGSGEPVGEWAKYKPKGKKANTDDVLIKEYSKKEEKLVFPAYQYKDGKLFEVGKLSGLPKEEESKVKKQIDAGKTVVVEVSFQERMSSGKFRHMGYSRLRPDKPAKEVKYSKAFISIRHAQRSSTVSLIEQRPDIQRAIESLCRHSGGNKNTYSIVNFLREKLGNELVQYSDKELINYIEECKNKFRNEMSTDDNLDVGLIGLNLDEYEDKTADYITHGEK